ncbi:MAG: hypothetical protein RLZZ01_1361 [Actinomycetota bacterium]
MRWAERWTRATERPRLLVVGGASLDIIHVGSEPVATPGGAGLYTALAATRAGAEVTMLAPFPDPMPPELAPVAALVHWVGPTVDLDGLPRFEIAYDERGEVTLFREHVGAEPTMTPDLLDLVDDLPRAAYCVPFLDADVQRRFIDALRARDRLTATATYGTAASTRSEVVRGTLDLVDLSFCNESEAKSLFGEAAEVRPGRLRFVTRGARGVSVFQGDHRTDVDATPVRAIDPTGAGDTFCGTVLARILHGEHPVEAARHGVVAAAEEVGSIGPTALLRPGAPPVVVSDPRVRVDDGAVERIAELVGRLDDLHPFEFTDGPFPTIGDPETINWFAAATLQQYGFWYEVDRRWAGSMHAPIDGTRRKGSDYLWSVYRRWADRDPEAMAPLVHASLTVDQWKDVALDDDGHDPFPDSDLAASLSRSYGRTLVEIGTTPDELVSAAAASPRPMASLLTLLDHVGGYREDPLRKKSALLGVILRQRPEEFLPPGTDPADDAPPIVDYHVQRSCLRTGMVDVVDADLRRRLIERTSVSAGDEAAVRRATHTAVARLSTLSGAGMGAVDWFLFSMRHHCPEATTPDCRACPADPVCAHRTDLFQPVFRTAAY